jgi:hypothetical protein
VGLSTRNAIEITETDFDHDVRRLVAAIEYALGERQYEPPVARTSNAGRNTCLVIGIVGAIAAVIVGVVVILAIMGSGLESNPTPEVAYSPKPTYSPTGEPPSGAPQFDPAGSWTVQVEGQPEFEFDMDLPNRYHASNDLFVSEGKWTYTQPYLRLQGYIRYSGMQPKRYDGEVTIERWEGSRFVGVVTDTEYSARRKVSFKPN